jgi:hypothetical protein
MDAYQADLPVVSAFQTAIRVDRPGLPVVGEDHSWANEDSRPDCRSVVDEHAVLDFDVVSNLYIEIYIDAFAQDAVFTDLDAFTHLALMPDACSRTDLCQIADLGCGMDANIFSRFHFFLDASCSV